MNLGIPLNNRHAPSVPAPMKPRIFHFFLLSCTLTGAQEPAAPSEEDWKINVELKVFAASATKLNPLTNDLLDPGKVSAAAEKLEQMVEKGEAELVGTILSQTTNNRAIEASQGEEVRYPIEFERPHQIEGKPGEAAGSKGVAYPATTFETRKVGLSLKADAWVSPDGNRFVLEAHPSRTWLVQWDEFENGRLANNDKIITKQPRFASAEVRSTVSIAQNERVLLGVHPVPGAPGKMEVMLLRVWSTPRKKQ
jgi:hypothetical protein